MAKSIVQKLNDIVEADGRDQVRLSVAIGISLSTLRKALTGLWPKQYDVRTKLENWIKTKEGV